LLTSLCWMTYSICNLWLESYSQFARHARLHALAPQRQCSILVTITTGLHLSDQARPRRQLFFHLFLRSWCLYSRRSYRSSLALYHLECPKHDRLIVQKLAEAETRGEVKVVNLVLRSKNQLAIADRQKKRRDERRALSTPVSSQSVDTKDLRSSTLWMKRGRRPSWTIRRTWCCWTSAMSGLVLSLVRIHSFISLPASLN